MSISRENDSERKQTYYDEISLFDLWLVLTRNKWLILGAIILCTGTGLLYTMTQEPTYEYSTNIELAQLEANRPLESSEAVKASLNQSLIPMLRSEMADQSEEAAYPIPRAQAEVPEGSTILITIRSEGSAGSENEIRTLHERLVQELGKEHNPVVERKIAELNLKSKGINSKLQRLGAEKKRVEQQILELEERLEQINHLLTNAPLEARDESSAMTQLIIQAQVEESKKRLGKLFERLHIELPEKADEYEAELVKLNNKIDEVQYTKVRMLALPLEPIGTASTLIVAFSVIFGVILGIFSAFFKDFVRKAREMKG